MADNKDTIYIDIDDDITAIIDKLAGSSNKIVALVLPKRATVLQSQVNMKLLKRAADDAQKNIVLITGESGLLSLAGAAGIHVARTLSSKPEIPGVSTISDDEIEDIDEPDSFPVKDFDARNSEDKPIGEITGATAVAASESTSDLLDDDTIELDNSDEKPEPTAERSDQPKEGKDRKKKIPNFNKFRNRILLAILVLIGLGVLFYFALEVWPHATVKIYTKQTSIPTSFTANLSADANKVDAADEIMPAVAQTEQKSYSQTVPASGQKDIGTRASGTVDLTLCTLDSSAVQNIPAGTGVSTNNLTYITQEEADFSFDGGCPGGAFKFKAQGISITAQKPGENYNVSGAAFTVASPYDDVTGNGEADGGTSKVVRVVQQSDIDSAKDKLKGQSSSAIKQELKSQLEKSGLTAIPETFAALPSDVDTSADAGDQADNVTVTENVTYVMYGYQSRDIQQLIEANIAQQFDEKTQGILSYGLDKAGFKLNGAPTTNAASVAITTTVTVGPKLTVASLKQQVAGKRAGDIRTQLEKQPGVSKVQVDTSPFWVGSVPNDPSKVTIEFVKSGESQ